MVELERVVEVPRSKCKQGGVLRGLTVSRLEVTVPPQPDALGFDHALSSPTRWRGQGLTGITGRVQSIPPPDKNSTNLYPPTPEVVTCHFFGPLGGGGLLFGQ